MPSALANLPPGSLRSLSSALRDGPLMRATSRRFIEQVTGTKAAPAVVLEIDALRAVGTPSAALARMVDAIADAKAMNVDPLDIVDLVVSGPEIPGVPMGDTSAAIHELVEKAEEEILLVGYTIFNGKDIFEGVANRMKDVPDLDVWFCLNVARPKDDTASVEHEIIARFATEFRTRHWPLGRLPRLYYDPRSLDKNPKERASLHAKCVVVDSKAAVITSANFTEAAQKRNIEVGVRVRHEPSVARLRNYFLALCDSRRLLNCPLS